MGFGDLHVLIYAEGSQLESCSKDPIGYYDGWNLYCSYMGLQYADPSGTAVGTHSVTGFMRFGSWSGDGYFSEDKMTYGFALDVGCDGHVPVLANPRVLWSNIVWGWDSPGLNIKIPGTPFSIGYERVHSVQVKGSEYRAYPCPDGAEGAQLTLKLKLCWEVDIQIGLVIDFSRKADIYCTNVMHSLSCCGCEPEEVYIWKVVGCGPTAFGRNIYNGRRFTSGSVYGGMACGDAFGGRSHPRRGPGPYGPRR